MARITNSPQELQAQIARAGTSPRVVLEATFGGYWAADTLAAGRAGQSSQMSPVSVIVANPCRVRSRSAVPVIVVILLAG